MAEDENAKKAREAAERIRKETEKKHGADKVRKEQERLRRKHEHRNK